MSRAPLVAGAVGVVTALIHAAVSLVAYRQMAVSSWDNALFEQSLAGWAGFGLPIAEAGGPDHLMLGEHWSPLLAVLAPVYAVFPGGATVLLLQVALVAVSAGIVAHLATRVAGTLVGAVVGLLYALSFGLVAGVQSDFHEVALALPLLAMSGARYVERRYVATVAWAAPLVLVKEDLGLTVAMIGVVLWLARERRLGTVVVLGGLVAAALTVLVVMPAVATGEPFASSFRTDADRGLLTVAVDQLGDKAWTVVLTLAVTGFAALLSPWVLLVLPTFAWRFLGDNPNYWGTDFHYAMVLMPIVFVAFVDAWKRREGRLMTVPLAIAVVTALLYVPSSVVGDRLRPSGWQDPPRAAAGREAVASVPKGASVETDISLLKHLSTERTAYWLGTIGDDVVPDYVAFDVDAGLGSPPDPLAYAEQRYGGSWSTVFDRDGYVVVKGAAVRGGSST